MGSAARSLAKALELLGDAANKQRQHLAEYLEHLGKDSNWRRSASILDQLRGWCINPGLPKSVSLSSASGGLLIDHRWARMIQWVERMGDARRNPLPDDPSRAELASTPPDFVADVALATTSPAAVASVAAQPTNAPLAEGTKLDRYLILRPLGAGGMGVVYAAYDPELNRRVAIKLLHPKIMGSQDAEQNRVRLIREAQAMARLSHPHVIAVHDIGTFGEQVFLTMDFIEGGTLKTWLRQRARSTKEILDKFILAGRGLAAAHAAGLIHRDFKPDNVLIGNDGGVYVTDFGLARESKTTENPDEIMALLSTQNAASPLDVQLTKTGALMGTPLYMAPEQYRGEPLDARTDEFSFCVALYEALYGSPPFSGNSLVALGFNVLTGKLEPMPKGASVPGWLRQVVLRGLRTAPAERYPSMEALLGALSRERQRTRLGVVLMVPMLGLLTLGLWGLRTLLHRNETMCQASAQHLRGVWDDSVKQSIRSALMVTGHPQAEAAAKRVESEIERYTAQWAAMRIDACAATHVRGRQSAELLDLRMQCLDRRLQEVEALTHELQAVDRVTVERVVNARYDFTSTEVCADMEALRLPLPLPERTEVRTKVEALYRELAILKAQDFSGRYSEMAPRARTALSTAHAIGYGPAEAQATFILAKVKFRNGDISGAERELEHAAALSLSSRDSRVLAGSLVLIHHIIGIIRHQSDQAQVWQKLATAALAGGTETERIRPQLLSDSCVVASNLNRFSEAEQLCQRAIALQAQLTGEQSPETAAYMNNLASVYRHSGQSAAALEQYQRALAILVQHSGREHPLATMTLRNLASLFFDNGQFQEAASRYSEALSLAEQRFGKSDPRLLGSLRSLVLAERFLNNLPLAKISAERMLAISQKTFGEKHENTARAHDLLAQVLYEQGHLAECLAHRKQAEQAYDQTQDDEQLAEHLIGTANCLREFGKAKEALPLLDRAQHLRRPWGNDKIAPDGQFALAQTLWAIGSRKHWTRALAAARLARSNYEQAGEPEKAALAVVSAWIAQHETQ